MRLLGRVYEACLTVVAAAALIALFIHSGGVAQEPKIAPAVKDANAPANNSWGYSISVEPQPQSQMTYRDLKNRLNREDFLASLKALNTALNQVSDGATFVWKRKKNGLKGAIKPTSAFRNDDGQVCRHLMFSLYIGGYVKSIQSFACRGDNGRWVLEG